MTTPLYPAYPSSSTWFPDRYGSNTYPPYQANPITYDTSGYNSVGHTPSLLNFTSAQVGRLLYHDLQLYVAESIVLFVLLLDTTLWRHLTIIRMAILRFFHSDGITDIPSDRQSDHRLSGPPRSVNPAPARNGGTRYTVSGQTGEREEEEEKDILVR